MATTAEPVPPSAGANPTLFKDQDEKRRVKPNMARLVKWPRYIEVQRQRKILKERLKVPPAIEQFNQTLDKNGASAVFRLLNKYRPESKTEKNERLLKEAEAQKNGKDRRSVSEKPYHIKRGIKHCVDLIEEKKASFVVIAHDVDPIEVVVYLPALCRKMGIPYVIVKSKSRLGTAVHRKKSAVLVITEVRPEDKAELAKLSDLARVNFNDKYEERRRQWGGGKLSEATIAKLAARAKSVETVKV